MSKEKDIDFLSTDSDESEKESWITGFKEICQAIGEHPAVHDVRGTCYKIVLSDLGQRDYCYGGNFGMKMPCLHDYLVEISIKIKPMKGSERRRRLKILRMLEEILIEQHVYARFEFNYIYLK